MLRIILNEFISALLALLFAYAGVSKLINYRLFQLQLSRSPFITDFAADASYILPIAEIVLACLIIYRPLRKRALYGVLFLLTLFTAYLYAMLHFSYYIPCSCGVVIAGMSWQQHIFFNIIFLILCVTDIVLHSKDIQTDIQIPAISQK